MDADPKVAKPVMDRLIRYLPILAIGHLFVTVPTFVISIALAYATFVQADATRKMQLSQTWPLVSYGTSNTNDSGEKQITFNLTNDGVGPARLKAMEFRYKGRALDNPRQFFQLCCGDDPSAPTQFVSGNVTGTLRPGESHDFIRLDRTSATSRVWDRLNVERWKVEVKSCYCSIFDDCWVLDSKSSDPSRVDQCPANWALFVDRPAGMGT